MGYHKYERPIDLLPEHPTRAIEEIDNDPGEDYILEELETMFFMAMAGPICAYTDISERVPFVHFYYDLRILIQAIFSYTENPIQSSTSMQIFCKRYTTQYVEIELGHFIEAVISYQGRLFKKIFRENLMGFYYILLTLCKTAYLIVQRV